MKRSERKRRQKKKLKKKFFDVISSPLIIKILTNIKHIQTDFHIIYKVKPTETSDRALLQNRQNNVQSNHEICEN